MKNLGPPSLVETLKEAGIENTGSMGIEVIQQSRPDADENRKIYEKTNKTLLSLANDGKLEPCIHVTGEMRALSDPLHRLVCRTLWEKYKARCDMVTYVPSSSRTTPRSFVDWNKKSWISVSLRDYFDTLDILSDGIVNLYFTSELERIHYSVFGNEYVLLQAMHKHGQHVKEVWLLRSGSLNKTLAAKAKELLGRSEFMQPMFLGELLLSVNSPVAMHILFSLCETGNMAKEKLYDQLTRIDKLGERYLLDLKSLGLVEESGDSMRITEDGKEYLNLFG